MKIFRHYSNSASLLADMHILSAVRTPVGLLNGILNEFTAPQLGSFAVKEALLRAAVPCEDLQNIFLGCVSHTDCHEEVLKRIGLSKTAKVSLLPTTGMKSVVEAVKFLLGSNYKVCIAGGMESFTNQSATDRQFFLQFIKNVQENARKILRRDLLNIQDMKIYVDHDYYSHLEANNKGAFFEEILKINFRKNGQQIVVTEDETSRKQDLDERDFVSPSPGDGAAAIVISKEDYCRGNGFVPLGKIISFAEEHTNAGDLPSVKLHVIEKALKAAGCDCKEIARWEIVSLISNDIINCRNCFNIDSSLVNKDGGVLSFANPVGMSGVRAVGHLVHSLSAGELGCAVSCDFSGATSAVIVKKLETRKSSKPQLTLYTKHPCPLCDELKYQLKPFEGRFSLEEVDIEAKQNEKYRELFQYEIPVLFMDGVFLCKNRLDVEHFNRRLVASEKSV